MSETTGGVPMFVCGPTTGCGKLTPMERIASGWITPRNCVHCGREWRRLPSQEITLTGDLLYAPAAGARLDQLAELKWDWDSYGAPPIGKQAIDCARRLMAVLSHPPQIVPTSHGGVQLEWHREGVEVEITIPPEGGTEFYVDGER